MKKKCVENGCPAEIKAPAFGIRAITAKSQSPSPAKSPAVAGQEDGNTQPRGGDQGLDHQKAPSDKSASPPGQGASPKPHLQFIPMTPLRNPSAEPSGPIREKPQERLGSLKRRLDTGSDVAQG